ncbi:hypothetical protein CPB83DRAFT_562195 [Crepidotus variabilis]|uniref:RING-type domain-containing protein n=1 Tax=Crepidotus variabilis TaxID=179855 RepID=A0A9P6E9U6_9AGAR|nr:hypothetical protein CPB83DRAFT_562195 [Crepidotus variabilis]
MTQLRLTNCAICSDGPIALDQFLFFSCGHKACKKCVGNNDFRKNPLCHECRQPKGAPHKVYLDFEEVVEEQRQQIIDGLNKIDMVSPGESIDKAGKKIRRFYKKCDGDPEACRPLLEAANDLQERVAPMFAKHATMKEENESLLARLHELEAMAETNKQNAKLAKILVDKEKDEAQRHYDRAQRYLSRIERKEDEILKLTQQLEEKNNAYRLLQKKTKGVDSTARKRIRLVSQPQEEDDSLVIEGKPEITPPKRIKRSHPPTVLQDANTDKHERRLKRRRRGASSNSKAREDDS